MVLSERIRTVLKIAIESGNIITMSPCKILSASVDYNFYDRMNILLCDFGANMEKTEFANNVYIEFSLSDEKASPLQERLTELSNGKYMLTEHGMKFAKSIE